MRYNNLVCFEPEKTSLDQAQELAWDAMDESSSQKRKLLAKKALSLSEDCADAYSILAAETKSLEKAIELYEKAVDAGKRAIRPKRFRNCKGHFWGASKYSALYASQTMTCPVSHQARKNQRGN